MAAAIHAGNDVRPEVAAHKILSDEQQLREEDPFTDELASIVPTSIVGRRSRFELDLNRPRDAAIYLQPEQAWGLNVWRGALPEQLIEASLAGYEMFYATVERVLEKLVARYGRVVVLDIHSYNHRRDGADAPPADPRDNPDVNLGTGSLDRDHWAPLVNRFIADLEACSYRGGSIDVRENVRFTGGEFVRWMHRTFPGRVCGLAVEFKKTFMDEWTGKADQQSLDDLRFALQSTLPGLLGSLRTMEAT